MTDEQSWKMRLLIAIFKKIVEIRERVQTKEYKVLKHRGSNLYLKNFDGELTTKAIDGVPIKGLKGFFKGYIPFAKRFGRKNIVYRKVIQMRMHIGQKSGMM